MAKIIHSMVRVLDLDRSLHFYRTGFALEESYRLEFSSFILVYLRNAESDMELELTVNRERTAAYEHGDGYGHLAFVVDDLDTTHRHFVDAGFTPKDIVDFAPDGDPVARFFFVDDPDGYSIEVLQRGGHFQ